MLLKLSKSLFIINKNYKKKITYTQTFNLLFHSLNHQIDIINLLLQILYIQIIFLLQLLSITNKNLNNYKNTIH